MVRIKLNTYNKYILVSFVSLSINLLVQSIILESTIYKLELAIFFGTVLQLFIKYFLDKKYVFHFKPKNITQNRKLFFTSVIVGVFPFMVYLTFTYSIHLLFNNFSIILISGTGLLIAFSIKFYLDKKFVFK